MIRTLAAAILLGAAAPALAAPITYDFTAFFTSGPLDRLTGSFTQDGDALTGFDLLLGGVRFDRANVGVDRFAFFLFERESIYGMLDGSGPGISIGTTDFSLARRTTVNLGAATTVEYGFDYTLPGLDDLVSADRVTVVERAAAVPEPASWATMIAGFALAGLAVRRRRPATCPA